MVRCGRVAIVVLGVGAGGAAGQEGCDAVAPGNDLVVARTLPGIGRVSYITKPHFLCEGGVEIFADSAVAYGDRGMSDLIGSVRYLEASRELLADEARYFSHEGRLQAQGHVFVSDSAQGSSIQNGDLVYLLKTDFRDQDEMTVTTGADGIRPVAILTPARADTVSSQGDTLAAADTRAPVSDTSATAADTLAATFDTVSGVPDSGAVTRGASAGPAPPRAPYTVVGDRIFLLGSGYFTASGSVEIQRDSLSAFADSTEYDESVGDLELVGSARVESQSYDLTGRTITMADPGGGAGEVRARRSARLEGEDLLLTSAQIGLFLVNDELERLVATPIGRRPGPEVDSLDLERPRATVQGFQLSADSLEVRVPDGVVERVFASGRARSVSNAQDSLNVELLPEIARSDWLEGDTVIVTFRPPGSLGDSTAAPQVPPEAGSRLEVDEIIAMGRARSLYRLPPSDSTARVGTDPPAVHYVVGDEIHVLMQDRAVERMRVIGQTRGVHLEPLKRAALGDSTVALPDTSRAGVDTLPTDGGAAEPGSVRPIDGARRSESPARAPSESTTHEPARTSRPRRKERPWIRP